MSEENIVLNFNDAINALNSAAETFKIDVWVPSKEKYISFKQIDAKQQKNLLSAAIDNSVYNTDFISVFYNILKDNILNEDKSIVDSFTFADRSFIAIALRSQISEELSVKFTDDKTEKIKISELLSAFNNYKNPEKETLTIKNENVTISTDICLPSFINELQYEEQFSKEYKKIENLNSTKDLQTLVSEAFISETSKYITSLTINDNIFDFSTLTFNQKIKIVEKLSSGLIQKILEKISNWKKDIDSYLTVKNGDDSKVITIDSLLFLS
jgi:hypothetical protein